MAQPAANFPSGMPGEPVNGPVAVSGRPQPTVRGPRIKTVQVKAHTRQVKVNPKPSKPRQQPQQTQTQQPFDPAIQAAVDLRFQPQIQANQQQIRNAQFGQIRAQHWYDDYQNMLAANQKAVAGQAQALAQTLGAYNPPVAQTGNAQADALAQQAQQSQKYLGQSFAGTQGQLTQNVANEFATGLMPGAALRAGDVQQGLTNQIGQLQQQGGQLKAQAGEYGTGLKAQADAAAQKQAIDSAKIQASLAIAGGKLDLAKQILANVTVPNTQSQIQNRSQTQQLNRVKVRQKSNQDKVGNALKVNELALKAYLGAHPELKNKGGGGGFTPTQVHKAGATFRTLVGSMDESQVHNNPQGAIEALVKGKKTDPVVANAVVESILNNGSVSRNTATAYFRATGHHLRVAGDAKPISKNLGQMVEGLLQRLGS